MKRLFTAFVLFVSSSIFAITGIYSKSYGQKENTAVIFVHGGPKGNSTLFEGTTAQKLSEKGFYVIVYDRRGEGRSPDETATFTYREAIGDLKELYKLYNITKANILAHSFGGLVATLFTEQNPDKVSSLILAGALFSQQETYNHILDSAKKIYRKNNDPSMLFNINTIKKLEKNSAEYRKQCFEIASVNNFFKMPYPTAEANILRNDYEMSEFSRNNIRNDNAPILFYRNESQVNIDTKPTLRKIKKLNVKIFALYGKQDLIFSLAQLNDMRRIVSERNFKTIDNCSHYLFVDQQKVFIETIEDWIKKY